MTGVKRCLTAILCIAFLVTALGISPFASGVVAVPDIGIGYQFFVALRADGTAVAWGKGDLGTLGNGSTDNSAVPVDVTMPNGVWFKAISVGYDHVIALSTDGRAWTWGSDNNGQLGTRKSEGSSITYSAKPEAVEGALFQKRVVAVAAGNAYSLALTSEGELYAWGSIQYGILGDGASLEGVPTYNPVLISVDGASLITDIYAGAHTAAVLDSMGSLRLWGENGNLQAGGDRSDAIIYTPTAYLSFTKWPVEIAFGADHTSVLTQDGRIQSFGLNSCGQFGNANVNTEKTAISKEAVSDATFLAIAAGARHMLALAQDGSVYAWGKNHLSQCGQSDDIEYYDVPTKLENVPWSKPIAIAAAYDNSAVLDTRGYVYIWGSNQGNELGEASLGASVATPVEVKAASGEPFSLGAVASTSVYYTQVTAEASVPAPTFTLTLPTTLDVGVLIQKDAEDTDAVHSTAFEVSAAGVGNLFGEKRITVSISTADGVFALRDGANKLPYTVYDAETGGNSLKNGDVFASFVANGTVKGRVDIDQSVITRKGTYSGTMIFTVQTETFEGAGS